MTTPDTEELCDTAMLQLRFQVAELIDAALVAQQTREVAEDEWEEEEEEDSEDWMDTGSSVGMAEDDSTFWLDTEGKQSAEGQLPSVQDLGPCSRYDFPRTLHPTTHSATPVAAEPLPCNWLPSSAPVALAVAPNEAFSPEEQDRLRASSDKDKMLRDAAATAYAGLYEGAREEACRIIQARFRNFVAFRALTRSWRDDPEPRPNFNIPATFLASEQLETKTPTTPSETGSKAHMRQRMRLPLPDM